MTTNADAVTAALAAAPHPPKPRHSPRLPRLGDLRVGRKLALIALSFGVPLGTLTTLLTRSQQSDITFAQHEQVGAGLLGPVNELRVALNTYTAASLAAQPGAARDQARREIIQGLDRLDAAARRYPFLQTSGTVAAARKDFAAFERIAPQLDPVSLKQGHDLLAEGTFTALNNQIAQGSKLLLDPEATSYYTMDLAVHEAWRLLTLMSSAGLALDAALAEGRLSAQLRRDLQADRVLFAQQLARTTTAAERALKGNPGLQAALGPRLEQGQAEIQTYLAELDSFLTANPGVGAPQGTEALRAAYASALRAVQGVQTASFESLGGLLADRVSALRRAQVLALLLIALALLLAFALLLAVARAITRPLGRLAHAAQALGQGDLNVEVQTHTRDEIGTVARSFNDAVGQLREVERNNALQREEAGRLQQNIGSFLDVTMDIASGDLTKRGQVTEDVLGNVVDSINLMVDELSGVLREVQGAAASVSGGSAAMLATTEQIAHAADTTSAATRQVSAQVGAVTGGIREVARDAQLSADAARQALAASEQGQQAVLETLGGMENIRREVQGVARRIKTLGERSLEIQDIVDTISRLSSQTNLLALNAAIEAAGAGAAGSRFAIVADEVRKLADSSAQATARIATLIKTVQLEIQEVVTSVEDGTREVEQGYRVAGTAGEQLRELGRLAQEAAAFSERIRQATGEQVRQVEQVGGAVQDIERVADESSASVAGGRQAAEELRRLAGDLGELLARFRLTA